MIVSMVALSLVLIGSWMDYANYHRNRNRGRGKFERKRERVERRRRT